MVHLNSSEYFVNHPLCYFVLHLLYLSIANCLAVSLDASSALTWPPATILQNAYPYRQEISEESISESIQEVFDQSSSLLDTIPPSTPGLSKSAPAAFATYNSLEISSSSVLAPSAPSIKKAVNSKTQSLWNNMIGNDRYLRANETSILSNNAREISLPRNVLEYNECISTISIPESIKSKSTNILTTSPSRVALVRIPTNSESDPVEVYVISVTPAPKISFTQPLGISQTSHKPTSLSVVECHPTGESKLPSFPQLPQSINYIISPWTHRPLPKVTGMTVLPALIPDDLISTFFGDLGWARTKGYVVPINSDGVMGWHKAVITGGTKIGGGFNGSDRVPDALDAPDFPSRQNYSTIAVDNVSMSHYTIHPTSISNTTYNDSLKIAAIQTFSQIGVIFLALLIVIAAAFVIICCSSLLKWPMKVIHAIKFRDIDMLKDLTIPSKLRAKKIHEEKKRKQIERKESVYGVMGDTHAGKTYFRGKVEAIVTDGGSLSFDEGSFDSTISVSTVIRAEDTRDESIPTMAAFSSGSQSKVEGSRMRIMNQSSWSARRESS